MKGLGVGFISILFDGVVVERGRLDIVGKEKADEPAIQELGRPSCHLHRVGDENLGPRWCVFVDRQGRRQSIDDCLPERIRYTLAHEMCHLATWIIDKDLASNHDKLFWKW